jgi:hypothetical protein
MPYEHIRLVLGTMCINKQTCVQITLTISHTNHKFNPLSKFGITQDNPNIISMSHIRFKLLVSITTLCLNFVHFEDQGVIFT